jgi:ankyrin repeat protein
LYSFNDNDSCADLLLERLDKKTIDTQDPKGRTAMHAAAFNNHVECMQLLLKYNANACIVDESGCTPLMMAASFGHSYVLGMYV